MLRRMDSGLDSGGGDTPLSPLPGNEFRVVLDINSGSLLWPDGISLELLNNLSTEISVYLFLNANRFWRAV